MPYLEKWFLGDLFLPFIFLVKITKMQRNRFTSVLGREEVIGTRKIVACFLIDLIFPSTLLPLKGS